MQRGGALSPVPRGATGDERTDRDEDRHDIRDRVVPEDGGEPFRPGPVDDVEDPVLLQQARGEPHVLGKTVRHHRGGERQPDRTGRRGPAEEPPPAGPDIEQEQRRRQQLEADRESEDRPAERRPVAPAPGDKTEGEGEQVEVAKDHLEDEREEHHDPGRGPRARGPGKRPDAGSGHHRGHTDQKRDPDPPRDLEGQRSEHEEGHGDERGVPELTGEPEVDPRAGVQRRAIQQVLRREPVRPKVVARREREGDQHRHDRREERGRDARGVHDPCGATGYVRPIGRRDAGDQATRSPR